MIAPLAPSSTAGSAMRVAELASKHAAEGDRAGRLVDEVADAIRDEGLPGLGLPRAYGGDAVDPRTLIETFETIAAGDAAAAWVAMITATSSATAAYLPARGAEVVFSDGRHSMTAGVFAPRGRAIAVEGGYRVSGRWPFASGCRHATWISGGCLVDGDPSAGVITTYFPIGDVTILDTWHVAGLRGTGSNDFEVEDVFVPQERTTSLFEPPVADDALYGFPTFGLLALGIAGVALGIGRGAITDLLELAGVKVPTGSRRRLAERAAVQEAVARAEAAVAASRAFLLSEVDAAWHKAVSGEQIDMTTRARLRLACTHSVDQIARAVDAMYMAGGGTSIYETSRLQQRFRDIHTATQHLMVAQPTWEVVGRVMLDIETDTAAL